MKIKQKHSAIESRVTNNIYKHAKYEYNLTL